MIINASLFSCKISPKKYPSKKAVFGLIICATAQFLVTLQCIRRYIASINEAPRETGQNARQNRLKRQAFKAKTQGRLS